MRRTITDDEFEQALTGAQRSLFRFEQQPEYAIDDEGGLFAAFRRGELLEPDQAPGLRAWFEQVREQTRRGLYVERVRIVDSPPTEYQRWLQHVDRWNRAAGEDIHYLPRWAISSYSAMSGLGPESWPFGTCDWWLIDQAVALVMHIGEGGVRTEIELVDSGVPVALAIRYAGRSASAAREVAEREAAWAAAETAKSSSRAA